MLILSPANLLISLRLDKLKCFPRLAKRIRLNYGPVSGTSRATSDHNLSKVERQNLWHF